MSGFSCSIDGSIKERFDEVCRLIRSVTSGKAEEKLWAKMTSFYIGERFVRVIPFKDHINIEAKAVLQHKDELTGYKLTPKGMLQIFDGQPVPTDLLEKIISESLTV